MKKIQSIFTKIPKQSLKRPTFEQIQQKQKKLGLKIENDSHLKYMQEHINNTYDAYDIINSLDYKKIDCNQQNESREYYKPENDKHNGWFLKFKKPLKYQNDKLKNKKLDQKTITLKDSIALKDVPMSQGSKILKDFIPDEDALIVKRILEAGGQITGKTNCESYCSSGSSVSSDYGLVHNAHKYGYTAGGSSSGSGVLVAQQQCDLSVGGDQGGSIRIPSCWNGLVGMKPTHGSVPYQGAFSIEPTLDHLGPMTRTVKENALFLEVLQNNDKYLEKIDQIDTQNFKIGVINQAFHNVSKYDEAVHQMTKESINNLQQKGFEVTYLDFPDYDYGCPIWTAINMQGCLTQVFDNDGCTYGQNIVQSEKLVRQQQNMKNQIHKAADSTKLKYISGELTRDSFKHEFYIKACNMRYQLIEAYENLFKEYDVILTPTISFTAPKIPENMNFEQSLLLQWDDITLMQFNATGHPALNLPVGKIGGLPVGMQIISKLNNELSIYQLANYYESMFDWETNCWEQSEYQKQQEKL